MKVYEVTVHWTAVRYVVAGDSSEAEEIAANDVGAYDVEHDFSEASEVTAIARVPEYERDQSPLSPDGESEWTVAEWLACPHDPGARVRETIAEWNAARPTMLADVPAWLAREPRSGRRWCAAMTNGMMVTNGHAMLLTEGNAPISAFATVGDVPEAFQTTEGADAAVAKILVDPVTKPVSIASLRDWLGRAVADSDGVRVLGVGDAVINADYVAGWLLPALDVSGATMIEAGICQAKNDIPAALNDIPAALFRGNGWTVVIMPRRSETKVARLVEVRS